MNNNEERDWKDVVADFFQGLADLIDRAGEPIFSFIAVIVPFIAPVVIAQITATALTVGNILDKGQADWLAIVLEGIGIVGLAGLVVAIDKWIKSKNEKMDAMIYLLGTIDLLYFLFLVFVNVMLDRQNPDITTTQLVIKALICLVPLMAGGIYGYYRIINKDKIARADAKKEAYVIRQERREDKLKGKMIKAGINPLQTPVYQSTVDGVKEKVASDYKEQAFDFLTETYNATKQIATPRELTTHINKKYRVNLNHGKCKGTWTNYTKLWKASKGL